MMSDKENSVNVVAPPQNEAVFSIKPETKTLPVKKELYEECDCEVILYVDNREKKNQ